MLDPEFEENILDEQRSRTLLLFKIGTIAGSMVIDGKIMEGCHIRLLRNGKILFDGKMSSLKGLKTMLKKLKMAWRG